MASPDPVLHLIAGPNGAGKTTLATRVIAPVTRLPFVNADVIAALRWPLAQAEHAYEASQVAAEQRQELIAARTSFITETVFSHPSKLALIHDAQAAGYHVNLHVVLVPEGLTVARVRDRVRRGGHSVPEEKIRERYHRLWSLVVQARVLAERTYVYDNTLAATPLQLIASYEYGLLVGSPDWPVWTPVELGS
ncbi:MAG: zeta toxin family protein [Candidatus Nanopelagicales bacterium]|nr:zeta toxin family protein [Candidatus Nanopelagicales bacterium]